MRKILLPLPILALALCTSGCGDDDAPPVARVTASPRALRLGFPEVKTLHLEWQPVAPLEGLSSQPTVFLHLLDGEGKVVRTFDHPFPQRWREGERVVYDAKLAQSLLAPPLAPGKYRLTLGLYEGKERWPLEGLGEAVDRYEYTAVEVEVPGTSEAPRFVFSPQWLPPEPGGDRQVLARRWLNGDGKNVRGAIRVAGVRTPGTVWMVLRIPQIDSANERLEVEGTSGIPGVLVRGACGAVEGAEIGISGPGSHEIEVPIEAPPSNGACRIGLRANYRIVSNLTGKSRSVSLENAAWAPATAGRRAPQPQAGGGTPTEPQPAAGEPEESPSP